MEALLSDSRAWASQELTEAASAVMQAAERGDAGSTPASSATPAAGATVVVVGGGPGGLLAAHFLAAHHGCKVELFDKRQHPGPIPIPEGDADDDDRAFAIALNSRGADAVAAGGLDISQFTGMAGTHMCEVKDTLLCTGDGLPREGGGRGSALVLPFDRPRVVGSRQAFVRALLHLVESALKQGKNAGGAAGSIAFHWGASFESADLAARQATFQLAGGKTVTRGYDLLVGADGYWSRVRRAMEKQVPGMRITVVPPNRQYKVVRGLRPVECLRLGPSGASPGRLCMVKEAAAAAKASGGPPGNWFMSQLSEVAGVTAVLSMPHTRWQKLEGAGAAEWMAFLRSAYPSMPDSWTEEMTAQLAERPLHETGMQVHASQLHGPAVVLLGDAAHAVSPATSNGMNSALEDALVLHQVLQGCGGDLAALPQRYTAARLADAQALLWLDSQMSALAGRGGRSAELKASVVARLLLHKATGGWSRPHGFVLLKDGSLPYGEARRQVERDVAAARLLTTGAGLAVVAALAAKAVAAGAARLAGS